MKVHELLEKKLDEMSERDYEEFAAALGYQFGLVIKASGITDLEAINKDTLMSAMMDQDIGEASKGVYYVICDTKDIRQKLIG
jgi:hypothetical protein